MSITLHDPVGLSSSQSPLRGRASSIAIILLGSIWYTWIKHQESQPAQQQSKGYEPVPLDEMEEGKANSPSLTRASRDARD